MAWIGSFEFSQPNSYIKNQILTLFNSASRNPANRSVRPEEERLMPMDQKKVMEAIEKQFGSREGMLGFMLLQLSTSGQPSDVTFYKREPLLDVEVDQQLGLAVMYGAGPKKLAEMMSAIKFSDGSHASLAEIWTVNPMPKGGISKKELDAVDLGDGDTKIEPSGETMREIIKQTYHCKTREEEDRFLRRFIAS
jgi:hypothetical protein